MTREEWLALCDQAEEWAQRKGRVAEVGPLELPHRLRPNQKRVRVDPGGIWARVFWPGDKEHDGALIFLKAKDIRAALEEQTE